MLKIDGSSLSMIYVILSSLYFRKFTSIWTSEGFDIYPIIAGITLSISRLCFPLYCANGVDFPRSSDCIHFELHANLLLIKSTKLPFDQWHFPVSLICTHSPNKVIASLVKQRAKNLVNKNQKHCFNDLSTDLYKTVGIS